MNGLPHRQLTLSGRITIPETPAKPPALPAQTIRILALDGGGIRGILSARVLQEIEQRTQKPAAELFHLIAGTSIGGITACGLLSGKSAKALGDLYAAKGGDIFSQSLWRTVTTLDNLAGPKYAPAALETVLKAALGDTWLSQTRGAELLVTSYCIRLPKPAPLDGGAVQTTRTPYLFKTWKARGTFLDPGDEPPALDFRLREIARATSAAPTYFPPAMITNHRGETYAMVDGGVFANNPAMCALASARRLYGDFAPRFLLVSLGTGSLERSIDGDAALTWGEMSWLHPILNILMDGNADTVGYEADQELGNDHMRFDISTGTNPHDEATVNEDFDCATPDNIARIERLAQRLIERSQEKLDRVCATLTEPKWTPPPALEQRLGTLTS
ncbi:MAG TPA: patatin-like phospholipase family protein [Stellaceae bacterium]|nr:patatin-like phospholipase family protein [Stellaceae bacterium]